MITEFKINETLKSGWIIQNNELRNNNFIIYDLDKLNFGFDYPINKTERKQFIKYLKKNEKYIKERNL